MKILASQTRRDALVIALICLCIYLLTASGHLYSPDEETMYEVTAGIVTRRAVDIPMDPPLPVIALHPGSNGLLYSHFGILPSLLALPPFVIGQLLGGWQTAEGAFLAHLLISLINAPISALTAGVLALFVRRLGYSRAAAWIVALVFAFATPAWVYARTFFSEPLTALLLLVAVERAHAFRGSRQRIHALQCGLACGLILATRVAGAVLLPWVVVYLLFAVDEARRVKDESQHQPSSIEIKNPPFIFRLWSLTFWLVGLIPGLVLFIAYNLARGELPWSTGYGSESWVFTTPLSVSIPGMFWQPERGLLFYAPPVLLGLLGVWWFARRHRALMLLIIAASVSYTLLHAGRTAWEGGAAWGPRYILALLPLWMLPMAVLYAGRRKPNDERRESADHVPAFVLRLSSPVSFGCILAGLIVTLLGVLVNFNTYFNDQSLREQGTLFGAPTPIAAHWLLLGERLAVASDRSDRCALGNGFYPPEGQPGEQLPRRTGSTGTLACQTRSFTALRLLLDDRRPPDAPVGGLALLQNGSPVAGMQPGQQRLYTLALPPGRTTLELRSTTWNPRAIAFSERSDDLGVALMALEAEPVNGTLLPLVDQTIEPLPTDPVKRWAWYYQPTNHHLLDMWWWYLPRSEIGPTGTLIFGTLLVLVALGGGGAAIALLRTKRVLPQGRGRVDEARAV